MFLGLNVSGDQRVVEFKNFHLLAFVIANIWPSEVSRKSSKRFVGEISESQRRGEMKLDSRANWMSAWLLRR